MELAEKLLVLGSEKARKRMQERTMLGATMISSRRCVYLLK